MRDGMVWMEGWQGDAAAGVSVLLLHVNLLSLPILRVAILPQSHSTAPATMTLSSNGKCMGSWPRPMTP